MVENNLTKLYDEDVANFGAVKSIQISEIPSFDYNIFLNFNKQVFACFLLSLIIYIFSFKIHCVFGFFSVFPFITSLYCLIKGENMLLFSLCTIMISIITISFALFNLTYNTERLNDEFYSTFGIRILPEETLYDFVGEAKLEKYNSYGSLVSISNNTKSNNMIALTSKKRASFEIVNDGEKSYIKTIVINSIKNSEAVIEDLSLELIVEDSNYFTVESSLLETSDASCASNEISISNKDFSKIKTNDHIKAILKFNGLDFNIDLTVC